jgi:hypothetical protein
MLLPEPIQNLINALERLPGIRFAAGILFSARRRVAFL